MAALTAILIKVPGSGFRASTTNEDRSLRHSQAKLCMKALKDESTQMMQDVISAVNFMKARS